MRVRGGVELKRGDVKKGDLGNMERAETTGTKASKRDD